MPRNDLFFPDADGRPDPAALTAHGPSIFVDLEFDDGGRSARLASDAVAMIDTGASVNCIDEGFAASLGLPAIDRRRMGGTGGLHASTVYLCALHVKSLDLRFYEPLHGVRLVDSGLEHRILLGRPFLRHFVLVYDGIGGVVTLADRASRAEVAPVPGDGRRDDAGRGDAGRGDVGRRSR